MNKHPFGPDLAARLEMAQHWALKLAGVYAEIAKGIDNPSLQAIIHSLCGDVYGHVRTLAVFQTFTTGDSEQQHATPTRNEPCPTPHPPTE